MRKATLLGLSVLTVALSLSGQDYSTATEGRVFANPAEAKWEKADSGSESVMLREDAKTGATELLVHYPAGHVFPPHWHTANERVVLMEGRLTIEHNGQKHSIEPGGYAYLPAHQLQKMTCSSDTRCSFYVLWDGALDFHPVKE